MIDVWVIYERSDYANRPFRRTHASPTTPLPALLSNHRFSLFCSQRLKSTFFIYDSAMHCVKCDLSQVRRATSLISRVCSNWAYRAELKEILKAVSAVRDYSMILNTRILTKNKTEFGDRDATEIISARSIRYMWSRQTRVSLNSLD